MSCCIDLHYFLYFRYDLHCDMSGIEVVTFLGSFHLSQLCQPDHKLPFSKKILSDLGYRIPKIKDKFLTTTVIIFFINKKTHCTYFNLLFPGGSKRSKSQTCSQKLLVILSMYDLLLPPDKRELKFKEKGFCEFLILALFKETVI